MLDFAADLGDLLFQARELRGETAASLVRGQIILRLMLGAIQIVAHRFQFLERDVDRAVLSTRQE